MCPIPVACFATKRVLVSARARRSAARGGARAPTAGRAGAAPPPRLLRGGGGAAGAVGAGRRRGGGRFLTQCDQVFKAQKRRIKVKKRQKKRQPIMSIFLLHFCTFQGGFTFWKKKPTFF